MALITQTTVVKQASELAVGDKIKGTPKYDDYGIDEALWTVEDVQNKNHPVLGAVVQINVATNMGGFRNDFVEFVLRPADRIHVEA
jgi:hypothetical protein